MTGKKNGVEKKKKGEDRAIGKKRDENLHWEIPTQMGRSLLVGEEKTLNRVNYCARKSWERGEGKGVKSRGIMGREGLL